MKQRILHLRCSCCGGDAPALKQYFNRDTGYGLCEKCADRIISRGHEPDFERTYGKRGIHFAPALEGG